MLKKLFFVLLLFPILNGYTQTESSYLQQGIEKAKLKNYKGAMADYNKTIDFTN